MRPGIDVNDGGAAQCQNSVRMSVLARINREHVHGLSCLDFREPAVVKRIKNPIPNGLNAQFLCTEGITATCDHCPASAT